MSGAVLSAVALSWDSNIATRQQRADDLRFVRDVYIQGSTRMPFHGVDLEGMSLKGLNFACKDKEVVERCFDLADFSGANLRHTDMSLMDLSWADFTDADLTGADFSHSDLGGANLSGARNLDKANLQDTCNAATRWPDGFPVPPPKPFGCIPLGF
ncbi:pentapeptide repeat-containing protein [Pseudarthrobacter sp. NIBRBAC000502770]|uniref:pentapeptide repeat-containing protein n=1 Tax=Pseudarthrobacter sp. NIBRBAC000502770 TaxID=2590785 RepID=UPI001AEFC1D1|nr:pentapeptide repeat-containing protein [Pseudarthrobacter sp. NIBRBAC000502770]